MAAFEVPRGDPAGELGFLPVEDLRFKSMASTYSNPKKIEKTTPTNQWEFQDPKMEVLYHIRSYFWGISPYIALT
jgi:hypothetical protein